MSAMICAVRNAAIALPSFLSLALPRLVLCTVLCILAHTVLYTPGFVWSLHDETMSVLALLACKAINTLTEQALPTSVQLAVLKRSEEECSEIDHNPQAVTRLGPRSMF
jgi:hypothetical protein